MNSKEYLARIISRYNQPIHADAVSVQRLIESETDPDSAWSVLVDRGVVYPSLDRKFAVETPDEQIRPSSRPTEYQAPKTLSGVATVTANFSEMQKAEELAKAFALRLKPWGAVCNDEIVWYLTSNSYEVHYLGEPYDSARDSVIQSLAKIGIDLHSSIPQEPSLPVLVRRALTAWEGWEIASRKALPLNEPKWIDFQGVKNFTEVDNPFEPLLEIWCTGFRIVSSFTQDDPKIRLYMRPITSFDAES